MVANSRASDAEQAVTRDSAPPVVPSARTADAKRAATRDRTSTVVDQRQVPDAEVGKCVFNKLFLPSSQVVIV